MSSSFGDRLHITIFGESHGPAIGTVIEGLPAGEPVDFETLAAFLARRAPGNAPYATSRKEADLPHFLSGITAGRTNGAPICAVIENTNTRSQDYGELFDKPRPSHADYPAFVRYGGHHDMRGGGHFSGRLTAPLCIAGGICSQILSRRGITVGAHIRAIAGVEDIPLDPVHLTAEELSALGKKSFPVLDGEAGNRMLAAIEAARRDADSVGGIVECAAVGLPAGIGDPMFGGIENRIAAVIFGIPAVRGIEFGEGFAAAGLRGSEHNDPYQIEDGVIRTAANRHGGAIGGITTGMPLLFRTAFKPTPSIGREQQTVSLSAMEPAPLVIHGRHDPCIVPRAVPCVEAATAAVLLDALLGSDPPAAIK